MTASSAVGLWWLLLSSLFIQGIFGACEHETGIEQKRVLPNPGFYELSSDEGMAIFASGNNQDWILDDQMTCVFTQPGR